MGKYKKKRKHNPIRRGGSYGCEPSSFVTNWSGVYLDLQARKEVKHKDIIRIVIIPRGRSRGFTRYVEIRQISCNYYNGSNAGSVTTKVQSVGIAMFVGYVSIENYMSITTNYILIPLEMEL